MRTKQIPLRYQELQIPSAFIITYSGRVNDYSTYLPWFMHAYLQRSGLDGSV